MRILAAYKPSPLGDAVLTAAREEARLRGAGLIIARHVRPSTPKGGVPAGRPQATDEPSVERDDEGREVAKLQEELEALKWAEQDLASDSEVVLLREGGDPAAAILDLAATAGVDMIVVGVRHRSRVGKAVLGSESQQIILNADCMVLTVKTGGD